LHGTTAISRQQSPANHNARGDAPSPPAKLKKDLAAGDTDLAPLINNPPDYAASAKVVDLLLSLLKVGQVKAHKILNHARIAPTKTLGGLTGRQRGELLNLIRH
jgi:hypothetical protein